MPAPQGQSQQSQGDSSLGPFWIMAGAFALIWAIWYYAHTYISRFILQIKLAEAHFVGLFTHHAAHLITTIRKIPPEAATFETLANVSTAVGHYYRIPFAIILGVLAIVIFFSHANTRYKKIYNMQRLIDGEKENWPQITPVANLDLVKINIDEGPWAMSMTPMQFAKKHQLLQEEHALASKGALVMQEKKVASIRRDEAYQVFSLQVGRYWKSYERLSPHAKALFAIFAARADRNRDGAAQLLQQISASTATGKLDFSGMATLYEKHKNNKAVIKVTQSHAFELTVMASLLLLARSDGVLASADFLWLKAVDRPLWFMLNSIGRQTPFTEVAGPYAHWLAERKAGRRLSVPMVEEAVNALEAAIKEIVYIPDAEGQ